MRSWIRFASALVTAASAVSAAAAADFTINVPVTVANVPAATALKVYCNVFKAAVGAQPSVDVGSGSTRLVLTGGKYSGTVTVAFNAKATAPAASATDYSCHLGLEGKAANGSAFESSYMVLTKDWLGATGQTITITPGNPAAVSGKLK
jgi:hypothetical protein